MSKIERCGDGQQSCDQVGVDVWSALPLACHAGSMGQMITVGNATAAFHAYLSEPSGPPKGGLVMLHEIWGLVDHAKEVADRLRPRVWWSRRTCCRTWASRRRSRRSCSRPWRIRNAQQGPTQDAVQLMPVPPRPRNSQSAPRTLSSACSNHLEGVAGLAGRVAVTGFCFGGTYSFALAVKEPRLRAAVPFYGHSEYTEEELRGIGAGLLRRTRRGACGPASFPVGQDGGGRRRLRSGGVPGHRARLLQRHEPAERTTSMPPLTPCAGP